MASQQDSQTDQTAQTAKRPRASRAGFTLVELAIVLFIIGIIAGFAIPKLRDVSAAELAAAARRLSHTTRYLYEEAAVRGIVVALVFDLDHQAYWVVKLDSATGQFVEDSSLLSRRVDLPPDVRIADVVLPAVGKLYQGVAPTHFYPEGYADRTVVHLVNPQSRAYTLRIDPVRGWGEVVEGYKDFEALP